MAAGLPAFGFLEEFSRTPAEKAVDHRKALEESVAAALEEGYQRGYSAGRSEGLATADAAIRDISETCAAEKAAVQERWQHDIGVRLADIFAAGIADIAEQIERQVADLLQPWLLERLRGKAMRDFLQAIDAVVLEGVSVDIKGPQTLVDAIADRIGARTVVTTSQDDDDATVVVRTNGTVISANFETWMSTIRETTHE